MSRTHGDSTGQLSDVRALAAAAAASNSRQTGASVVAEDGDEEREGDEELRRQVNWTLGVNPQDVRFPVNIAEVAFTANFFAALTADKMKIFVNKRSPEERSNCKKKTIEFDVDHRPRFIVSYDCRDSLCVVFESKIEFYNLATLDKVGVYQTSLGEFVTTVASFGLKSPLGALWCLRSQKKRSSDSPDKQSTFTYWQDQVMVPQQVQFINTNALSKSEKYVAFRWTSETTILLTSKTECQRTIQPISFCSFDCSERRVLGRLRRRSVRHSDHFRLSPNGRLLLLLCRNKCILFDSVGLRQLHLLHRQRDDTFDHVISNGGDLVLLNRQAKTVEFYQNFSGLSSLSDCRQFELAKCVKFQDSGAFQIHAVGSLGVLFVFKYDGHEEGDQPKHYSSYTVAVLLDMHGHVVFKAEWPRSFIHLVTDELLVYLQYLSTKPFSAAHACIFNFNAPVARKSFWTKAGDRCDTVKL